MKEYTLPRIHKGMHVADLKEEAMVRGMDSNKSLLPKKKSDLLEHLVEGSIHLKQAIDVLKATLESELPNLRTENKRRNDEEVAKLVAKVAAAAAASKAAEDEDDDNDKSKLCRHSHPSVHPCTLALTEHLMMKGKPRISKVACDRCNRWGVACLYTCETCDFDICKLCFRTATGSKKRKVDDPVEIISKTKQIILHHSSKVARTSNVRVLDDNEAIESVAPTRFHEDDHSESDYWRETSAPNLRCEAVREFDGPQKRTRQESTGEMLIERQELEPHSHYDPAELDFCPPAYDMTQFTKNSKCPPPKSKIFQSKLGFTVWCSSGYPPDSWYSYAGPPTKEFDSTWRTKEEANLRAKYLFYWKNCYGLHPNELFDYADDAEADQNLTKQGLLTLWIQPDDSEEWTVGVVPDVAFEHLDNSTSRRHCYDRDMSTKR